jgi:hypothetical protein
MPGTPSRFQLGSIVPPRLVNREVEQQGWSCKPPILMRYSVTPINDGAPPMYTEGVAEVVGAEEHCVTAEELLDKLVPQHTGWKSEAHNWIYRGQPRDLPLLAKAHRDEEVFGAYQVDLTPSEAESPGRVRNRVEASLIERFMDELERDGLEVPPERPKRRTGLIARGLIEPRDSLLVGDEVRALAQHHGIPTALLDWSTQSLKAAYFAAAEAAKGPDDDKMVVWALHRRSIESRTSHQDFAIVTPPSWTNRNLFAQAGTFTHAVWDGLETVDDYLVEPPTSTHTLRNKSPSPGCGSCRLPAPARASCCAFSLRIPAIVITQIGPS